MSSSSVLQSSLSRASHSSFSARTILGLGLGLGPRLAHTPRSPRGRCLRCERRHWRNTSRIVERRIPVHSCTREEAPFTDRSLAPSSGGCGRRAQRRSRRTRPSPQPPPQRWSPRRRASPRAAPAPPPQGPRCRVLRLCGVSRTCPGRVPAGRRLRHSHPLPSPAYARTAIGRNASVSGSTSSSGSPLASVPAAYRMKAARASATMSVPSLACLCAGATYHTTHGTEPTPDSVLWRYGSRRLPPTSSWQGPRRPAPAARGSRAARAAACS